MKVIGRQGTVYFYEPNDECPHEPTDEELWQESFVLFLMDAERDVYSMLRVSQIPNSRGGRSSVWLNVWTPEHMYHRVEDSRPFDPSYRTKTSLCSGDLCRYEYQDGDHRWTVNDPEYGVQLELVQKDFHQGLGFFPEGALKANVAPLHIECWGQVSGKVSVRGRTYQVEGMGWRDHGAGARSWDSIRVHRSYSACFGPEFCTIPVSFIGQDGNLQKIGVVIRGDTVQFTDEFKFIAHIGEDGVTHLGGDVHMTLDGENVQMRFESVGACALNMQDGFCCADSVNKVTMGGRVGVGWAETSNNAQQGREPPRPCFPGVRDTGIYPRYPVR